MPAVRSGNGPPPKRERRPAGTGRQVSKADGNSPASNTVPKRAPEGPLRDLQFRSDVVRLHSLGPRAVYECLAELGARRLCRTEIEALVGYYAALDRGLTRTVGADRLPPLPPLRLIDGGEP